MIIFTFTSREITIFEMSIKKITTTISNIKYFHFIVSLIIYLLNSLRDSCNFLLLAPLSLIFSRKFLAVRGIYILASYKWVNVLRALSSRVEIYSADRIPSFRSLHGNFAWLFVAIRGRPVDFEPFPRRRSVSLGRIKFYVPPYGSCSARDKIGAGIPM